MIFKKENSKGILILSYIIGLGFWGYFTLTSRQDIDEIGMVINVVMFTIVLVIYTYAYKGFSRVNKIEKSLQMATKKIEDDFSQAGVMLWNQYKNQQEGLFDNTPLSEEYNSFMNESKRLELFSEEGFKCDIGDYINRDVIDVAIGKNLLNLVPGVMTGLGILGTFIGLSFGLQHFNTGTSADIAASIAPLMSGIKVAFHTSIYGMVFSLLFNYAYRRALNNAYATLDNFLRTFEWYVCNDSENDYYNRVLTSLPEKIGNKMNEAMAPHFERLISSMNEFTKNLSNIQLQGVEEIVDQFVNEMNKSLGDNFAQLGEVIAQTCELQKQNSDYMQSVLEKVGTMALNIQEINELSGRTVETLSSYIEDVEKLQTAINDSYMSVNLQLEENRAQEEKIHGYMEMLVTYEAKISEASTVFTTEMARQIELLKDLERTIVENSKNNNEALSAQASEFAEQLTQITQNQLNRIRDIASEFTNQMTLQTQEVANAAKSKINEIVSLSTNTSAEMNLATKELSGVTKELNSKLNDSLSKTFGVFDSELEKITQRLSGTIEQVRETTERVPEVVMSAYSGMETVLNDMHDNMTEYAKTMKEMHEELAKMHSDTQNA